MTSIRDPASISVLGAGTGALSTVRELRRRDRAARITLVAPRAELHDLPGINGILSGPRTRVGLLVLLDNFLQRMDVHFHPAEVTGPAHGGRTVHAPHGEVGNDALVIATGGRFIQKLPGIEHAITPCEGITAAERIRDRLREMQGGTIAVGFSGPDRMPKQAHRADLQAAAAQNLPGDLQGRSTHATFKVELLCIVDAIDHGTLIRRTPDRNRLPPSTRLQHGAKRGSERSDLRPDR